RFFSETAPENISNGQVKSGPLSRRNLYSHIPSEPTRHAIGPHQLYCPGRKFIFQHFIISCHCSLVSCLVCVTPVSFSMRVSCNGVKIDGTRNANKPRRSISY